MKQLLLFCSLIFLLSNCNDPLQLESIETEQLEPIETVTENLEARFSDTVFNESGEPMANAIVSLYGNSIRYNDITDENGEYEITIAVDQLPRSGYISMSITKDNFKPRNVTYAAPLSAQTYRASEGELKLNPCPTCLYIGEKSSELFHLGDDNYGGSENSQFQKSTDGTELDFELADSAEYERLRITLDIKGIQPIKFDEHSSIQFISNENTVAEIFLDEDSPTDGSYATYSFELDNAEAVEALTIMTKNHGTPGSDYDDWEFTCLFIEGVK